MVDKTCGNLTVQADMRFACLVLEMVREVTAPAQLPEKHQRRVEMAVAEAFANAVKHAYAPGSGGPITMSIELAERRLTISMKDGGIPFDESLEAVREKTSISDAANDNTRASGLPLIRSVMDEVKWISLGVAGKELQMTLILEQDCFSSQTEVPEKGVKKANELPAAPHTYTVRLLQPEDAIGVARCFFGAYGYSYPTTYFYEPKKIIELNKAGTLISVVVVSDQTGEVVGHCSVQRYGPGGTAECGLVVIAHDHQGRELTTRIGEFLEQEYLKAGICRLTGHEVTNHPVSQRMSRRNGFKPCALALGAMPATMSFKNMNDALAQRESCTVSMKFVVSPESAVICAPRHHRDMIARIYEFIDKPVTFQSLPLPTGLGETAIVFNRPWGIADIQVRRIGTDTVAEIKRCLRDLIEIGNAQTVYLELPLDQGEIDDICLAAEKAGFFFAGLSPSSVNNGESMFLQYLNTKIDMSRLRISTPMGKEIFDYVAKECQRLHR